MRFIRRSPRRMNKRSPRRINQGKTKSKLNNTTNIDTEKMINLRLLALQGNTEASNKLKKYKTKLNNMRSEENKELIKRGLK